MHWQWEPYQALTTKLDPSFGAFHQSWIYMVGKKHSGKADQSALASEAVNMHSYLV